ncbi:MAG: hypothetical protein ABH835_01440 [Patescibacteria group bacterium]
MNNLDQSILKTVCYFDLFDYPLTLLEIRKWLWQNPEKNLNLIEHSLNNNPNIASKQGFYFLKDREKLVELRKQRYINSQLKFKKRLKFIKILTYLPFVEGIFIANNLAVSNVKDDSDIDLIIVAKKNIWTTRLFTTTKIAALGLRPTPQKSKDKICLSVYLTHNHLNLEKYKINRQDIHYTYWADQIIPIYDKNNIYKKYREANHWIKTDLPNSLAYQVAKPRKIDNNVWKDISQNIFGLLSFEKFYKKIQLKKLPLKLKNLMNKDNRVVINDEILKFHDNDPREEIQKNWETKYNNLIT